jgi:hypothetical protein
MAAAQRWRIKRDRIVDMLMHDSTTRRQKRASMGQDQSHSHHTEASTNTTPLLSTTPSHDKVVASIVGITHRVPTIGIQGAAQLEAHNDVVEIGGNEALEAQHDDSIS